MYPVCGGAYNANTLGCRFREAEVPDHPRLHSQFKGSWSLMRHCWKRWKGKGGNKHGIWVFGIGSKEMPFHTPCVIPLFITVVKHLRLDNFIKKRVTVLKVQVPMSGICSALADLMLLQYHTGPCGGNSELTDQTIKQ